MDELNNNVVEEESRGLTFKDILFIIRKHWIAIVAFLVACTAGGFIWSQVETPTYKATGTMMVYYKGDNTAVTTEYSFSNSITNTVVGFVKTNTVLDEVSTQLELGNNLKISSEALSKNLTVTNSTGNLLITVSYTSSKKDEAVTVANKIIDVARETADLKDPTTAQPRFPMLDGNLSVVDYAKEGKKVSHTLRNTAIGLGAGVVLALAYVVIRELADNTFKSSEEIERILNIPVLAGIPDYHFDDEKKGGK